ncbi:MAG: ABC transporter permease [Candidatus Brocadiia bacterium]
MRIFRLAGEGLRALGANKLRTFFMMAGIIVGVASLTVVICAGQGTRDKVMALVARHGLDTLMIRPEESGGRGGDRSLVSLVEDDAQAIETSVGNVKQVAPVQNQRGQRIEYLGTSLSTMVFGVTPAWADVRRFDAVSGEFITNEDLSLSKRVCLLGQTVKNTLFGDADPLGQTIRVGNDSFTIKGVLIRKGASASGKDRDDRIVIPLTTASKRLFGRTYLDQIVVQVRDVGDIHRVAEETRALLRNRHGIRAGVEDDFSIREPEELIETASGTSTTLIVLLVAISAISMLVGGVVIMNLMLMSVSERTKEIGLRRAVGARKLDIAMQFIVETLLIAFTAELAGIVLGMGIATALSVAQVMPIKITWQPFILATLFCGVIALAFGFYPAKKAARTEPVRALRG